MNIKKFITFMLYVSLLLSGCMLITEPQMTMEDNGKNFDFPVGQRFQITLPSNPTTGYEWSVEEIGSLEIIQNIYRGSLPPFIGSGGVEIWTFEVIESPESCIVMVYSRPWESKAPIKKFKMTIN